MLIMCDCDRSGPLESIEDGVVIGDDLAIIEHESVVVSVVVRHVDDLRPAQLVLQLVHQLDLHVDRSTCLLRLWHSRKSFW